MKITQFLHTFNQMSMVAFLRLLTVFLKTFVIIL